MIGVDPRVSGAQRYSVHVERPGMLHAAFVRSPHAHARVAGVDASALPADCVGAAARGRAPTSRRTAARRATSACSPTSPATPATSSPRSRRRPRRPRAPPRAASTSPTRSCPRSSTRSRRSRRARRSCTRTRPSRPARRSRSACARCRARTSATASGSATATPTPASRTPTWSSSRAFRTPGAAHAPMEPHAALAEWEDGRLTLWTGTQTPFNTRADVARRVRARRARDVRVIAPPMGGSFGAKTFVRLEALVAALARKAGRPGEGDARPRGGVPLPEPPPGDDPRPRSARSATARSSPRSSTAGSTPAPTPTAGPGVATKMGYAGVGPYRIPHVRVDALAIYTNLPPNGAYRGYGAMQSVWASERTMDALAAELGMSPLELRRRNLLRDGDVFATGEVMHDVHFAECLDAAARGGRLRGRPARRRAVRPAQGDADAEPRGDRGRAQRRSATSCAARRARWARACASRSG